MQQRFVARVSASAIRLALYPCIQRQQPRLHRKDNTVQLIHRFLKDENAATAIEYGLIAAGIALAIIAVVNGLGSNLKGKFTAINSSLK